MATLAFDFAAFKTQFPDPQFPDPPFDTAFVEGFWNIAICFISPEDNSFLSPACQRTALNLMTAHLAVLASKLDSSGFQEQGGFVESATIDKITISVQAWDNKSQFSWYLNQTTYGAQLYALLSMPVVSGIYVGGSNELGSFRRSGGVFTPPS